MAAWSELLAELNNQDDPNWLDQKLKSQLVDISKHRGDAAGECKRGHVKGVRFLFPARPPNQVYPTTIQTSTSH